MDTIPIPWLWRMTSGSQVSTRIVASRAALPRHAEVAAKKEALPPQTAWRRSSARIAFRQTDNVGIREYKSFAAPWLACTLPCRRFADILAEACARLWADVSC